MTISRRWFLLAAAILGSCLPLTAQEPQVQGFELKWLDDNPQGLGVAQLTNRRDAAATAYLVQFERVEGDAVTVINSPLVEAVPRGAPALEPDQSKTFTAAKAPTKAATANTVRVVCAIFADGFTTGDELCVKRFLEKRRQLLREDIPHVEGFLNAALAQPKPDLNLIIGHMGEIITERFEWARTQTPFSQILAEARAHSTVQSTLAMVVAKHDKRPLAEILNSLVQLLETWRGDLESSKPELAQ